MIKEIWVFYKEITRSNQYFKKGDILTVSDYGNVLLNGQPYECKISNGYYRLCGEYLHRIIAEKFIPGWKKDYEIDHKDCNTLNNMVTNLLIGDHKQNMANILTRKHMSDSKTGCIPWNKGKHGLQTCWNKGQHWDEETKKKIIEAQSKKPVLQYTLDNKFIAEYVSVKEAIRQTKISHIVECCKHRYKSAGGYIWKYKEE